MNLLWDQEPVVAANDFSPFTGEVALPAGVGDASAQARPPLTAAAGTRPQRRRLLELGLAYGDGAQELEARACKADTERRQMDRAAGAGQDGTAGETPGEGDEAPTETPSVRAIAAVTEDIRSTLRESQRLIGELGTLKERENGLRRKLMELLNGGDEAEEARRRPAPSPGAGLPTLKWPRED